MTSETSRTCRNCVTEKPEEAFTPSQWRKNKPLCRECVSAKNEAYRALHREELIAASKQYRDSHKIVRSKESRERAKAKMRQRYAEDPEYRELVKAKAIARKKSLPPEIVAAQHQAWRQRNPEKMKEYIKRWRAKQPAHKLQELNRASRERHRVARQKDSASYYAKRYGSEGVISNEHLNLLHKWQDHCCFYCHRNLEGAETIEHVVPLSRNGTNHPFNVVLSCASCNYSKGGKIFYAEWRPENVAEAPRYHSLYGLKQLRNLLDDKQIAYQDVGDSVLVGERRVFILSSFWLGWAGKGYIESLAQLYPGALLFFDKELALRPKAIINVIKAKAKIAERYGARKLALEVPSLEEAKEFISTWHAMGFAYGTHYLGLKGPTDWHAIAAIKKDVDRYEIVRMAIRETVAGGVSRIIKHLLDWMPERLPIVAFTDARMGDGKSHDPAGFLATGTTRRTFFYATPEATGFKPRRALQKPVLALKADYYDPAQTQTTLARSNGIMRVEGLPLWRFELPV